jgi:hypothetical protein
VILWLYYKLILKIITMRAKKEGGNVRRAGMRGARKMENGGA